MLSPFRYMKEVIHHVFSNCRKPSVSRAIAEVIGAQEREDGYLQGTDCMVSWCFGHLAEYVSPDAYDEKFNQWRYEDLPIIPKDWKVTVSEDKKDQFYILKDCSTVRKLNTS